MRLPTGRPLDRRVRARLSAAGLAALAVAALWGASSKTAKPAEDVVLVAIENSTGDPVFDRTLPLAVAVQLEKDASVHVLSEERTRELLPAGAGGDGRAAAAARSLCRQTGATAWVTGSIAGGDGDLVLALNAESCRTGEAVFHEVVHLQRPEHVLSRLRAMAAGARRRLGELRMAHGGVGVETRA